MQSLSADLVFALAEALVIAAGIVVVVLAAIGVHRLRRDHRRYDRGPKE